MPNRIGQSPFCRVGDREGSKDIFQTFASFVQTSCPLEQELVPVSPSKLRILFKNIQWGTCGLQNENCLFPVIRFYVMQHTCMHETYNSLHFSKSNQISAQATYIITSRKIYHCPVINFRCLNKYL